MASTGQHRALWSILLPSCHQWANSNNKVIDTATLGLAGLAGDVAEAFKHNNHTHIHENMSILLTHMTSLLDLTVEYDKSESNNPMFQLWKWYQYYFTSHVLWEMVNGSYIGHQLLKWCNALLSMTTWIMHDGDLYSCLICIMVRSYVTNTNIWIYDVGVGKTSTYYHIYQHRYIM